MIWSVTKVNFVHFQVPNNTFLILQYFVGPTCEGQQSLVIPV